MGLWNSVYCTFHKTLEDSGGQSRNNFMAANNEKHCYRLFGVMEIVQLFKDKSDWFAKAE